MAKLDGGIFSRPRGKTAGIVFGAARTRQGKVATARQLVPPSNPNTAGQQSQRNKFKECLEIVRKIGADVYRSDWNRAVSQLAGFQSMMSILMNNMDSSFVLSAPSTTNLGTLHAPDTIGFSAAGPGEVNMDYSEELGDNGTDDDMAYVILIEANSAGTPQERSVKTSLANAPRSIGQAVVSGLEETTDYINALYFHGAGSAEGLLSPAKWQTVTTG